MSRRFALSLLALALCAAPASAHHSLSYYDTSIYKTVDGTVKKFEWTNPHAQLSIVVAGANGTTEWAFEGGSVGRLTSGGFTKETISAGDKISVAYNPKRDGTIGGFFVAVTTSNGKLYATERFRGLKKAE